MGLKCVFDLEIGGFGAIGKSKCNRSQKTRGGWTVSFLHPFDRRLNFLIDVLFSLTNQLFFIDYV